MAELPSRWHTYARLQQRALQNRQTDARSWSVEAGLDHIVAAADEAEHRPEDVDRAISTARRRETHRYSARRRWQEGHGPPPHPDAALHARLSLGAIRSTLSAAEWNLLHGVAVGRDYSELAASAGSTSAALRVRVLRLRRRLMSWSAP